MQTPYFPPEQPQRPRRRRLRRVEPRRRVAPQQTQRGFLFEVGAKLLVNGVLTFATATSLMRLVPYTQAHHQELQEVQAAVANAETQTSQLRADFSRYFDPRQTSSIMQEQTGRESPTQRQIVWVDPAKTEQH